MKSQYTQEKEEMENKHRQDVRFVRAECESVLREESSKYAAELASVREESARVIEEHARRYVRAIFCRTLDFGIWTLDH